MIKEYGSDFHSLDNVFNLNTEDSISQKIYSSRLFFSGRTALYELMKFGIENCGWTNIFVPEYYCHEVSVFIRPLKITINYYNNCPDCMDVDLEALDKKGNVILNVSFFGVLNDLNYTFHLATLIEDHTHGIASIKNGDRRDADYCFASLRKVLPVPCGGILWSPNNHPLPLEVEESSISQSIATMKLSGMDLKMRYLNGESVSKEDFRKLLLESESHFTDPKTQGGLPGIVTNLIKKISVVKLSNAKTENLKYIVQLIDKKRLLFHSNGCDFDQVLGLVLIFDDVYKREKMREHLINNAIYPAILWPEQFTERSKSFSDRMIFIHCDIRYDQTDMEYIAQIINQLE